MTTCLEKSCSFGLPRVPFVNCCQFMYLVVSLLVLRAGCGIWLYQFLIIAYPFTFLINDQNKHLPHLDLITDKTLEYITISEQEVRDFLENLDTSKAHGPHHVSPHYLKEGAPALSKPLSTVFNKSLQQGYFPPLWKDGYLTPIHKKSLHRQIIDLSLF